MTSSEILECEAEFFDRESFDEGIENRLHIDSIQIDATYIALFGLKRSASGTKPMEGLDAARLYVSVREKIIDAEDSGDGELKILLLGRSYSSKLNHTVQTKSFEHFIAMPRPPIYLRDNAWDNEAYLTEFGYFKEIIPLSEDENTSFSTVKLALPVVADGLLITNQDLHLI